jgi:hypothetical protein
MDQPIRLILCEYFPLRVIPKDEFVDVAADIQLLRPELSHDGD